MASERLLIDDDFNTFDEYIADCPSAYWTGVFERIRDYARDRERRCAELEKRAAALCDVTNRRWPYGTVQDCEAEHHAICEILPREGE